MLSIKDMTDSYQNEGYSEINAQARVCQDIVLKAISESTLNRNVTIKGGIVMRNLSGDIRRATQDIDLDFLRYPLEDSYIKAFVQTLNCLDGISIEITGDITQLSQQEYRGKRAYIEVRDSLGNTLRSKIDFGVHKNIQIEQDELCFDVCLDDDGAYLLANSKEQIFTEKLKSLLRFGPFSTRYKDLYDLCYLSESVNVSRLKDYITTYIFEDTEMKENSIDDIVYRLDSTFNNKSYLKSVERSTKSNWLQLTSEAAFNVIISFIKEL